MSHDTQLHRIVRPAVGLLASRTAVSPNHLTIVRIGLAAAAVLCFADGTIATVRIGAALFAVSLLLDRADGELARLTGRHSRFGHRLDLCADFAADATIFIALGIGASGGALGMAAPLLGIAAAIGVALLFRHARRDAALPAPARRRAVDADDLMLLVPLLAAAAGPATVLLLAGTVAPLAWLALTVADRPRARTSP